MNYEFSLLQNDYTICPRNWGMTDEIALFYRMYYICGGETYLRRNGRDTRLLKDHFYVFPILRPYTLWHNKDDPLEVLWFHVEMHMDFSPQFACLKVEENSAIFYLLKTIKELNSKPKFYDEIVCIFDIFLTLIDDLLSLRRTPPPLSSYFHDVADFVGKHIREEVLVQDMAQHVGLERSYFSRRFKSYFQMSPSRYILARKMSAAAKALVSGATVYQASTTAGYDDEKAFSRAFKKYMEVTPSNYKKHYIEQP
ncbi:MAG: AraC family transcriptional regulator [Treponema sp.]|nr:AraC family transcriptional regulator [Treponema sp.]